ncbi:hypothetical protein GCM10027034_37530 [Ramlibacter solisilvae]|uniref:Uncharacterized protein n=1 Tax=Ramlibacter tataouinensis TaxID=94132 RepID=A0A127JUK9_9BURK|nr:hypothetical protein [Ramlibacter tataouinensis]AMO23670.1 hypothetical protein UC35_13255 [Ramlibacter tataouinensis]
MYISVTLLMGNGKRLSPYAIRTQTPAVGWLYYEVDGSVVRAFLRRKDGFELLALHHARLVGCCGQRGALIEGVEYRRKGVKHSICDRQAWWCEAPPRTKPLLDHQARILAAELEYLARKLAGWGYD